MYWVSATLNGTFVLSPTFFYGVLLELGSHSFGLMEALEGLREVATKLQIDSTNVPNVMMKEFKNKVEFGVTNEMELEQVDTREKCTKVSYESDQYEFDNKTEMGVVQ